MSSVSPSLDDEDRISNLPMVLKHSILDRMPVHDAARTSILSKAWRNLWTMQSCLAFDKLFFLQVIRKKNEEEELSAFSDLVDMIFSVHTEPIFDIEIYMPPELPKQHIHRWIEHLSKQGVRVLKLDNFENEACLIPSNFFDFKNLRGLRLTNWTFSPPPESECFANLISVSLHKISISAHVSFGTKLKHLDLFICTGIEHLDLTNSSNIKRLILNRSSTVNWQWLEKNTKELEVFVLVLHPADFSISKDVNLTSLLSNCLRIRSLFFHDFNLQLMGPDPSMLKTLASKMVNLKTLNLSTLQYNLGRILNGLCLIRNLPNLQVLQMTLNIDVRGLILNPERLTIERHLESLDWKDVLLDQLQTVEIGGVVDTPSVLHITKLLLASSPSLRKMWLFCSSTVRTFKEKLRIKRKFLQLPAKSSEAQVYWFDD